MPSLSLWTMAKGPLCLLMQRSFGITVRCGSPTMLRTFFLVKTAMFAIRHEKQIVKGIIGAITINMMDDFTFGKRSA